MSDFERTLNDRGQRDARLMAQWLLKQPYSVQQIVSSSARRALATTQQFASVLEMRPENIQVEGSIYEAGVATLRRVVEQFDDALSVVVLVGHNPGVSVLAECLTGESVGSLPTCGICEIRLPLDSWMEITAETGSLGVVMTPKQLKYS